MDEELPSGCWSGARNAKLSYTRADLTQQVELICSLTLKCTPLVHLSLCLSVCFSDYQLPVCAKMKKEGL